jgi:hypothetical protein
MDRKQLPIRKWPELLANQRPELSSFALSTQQGEKEFKGIRFFDDYAVP